MGSHEKPYKCPYPKCQRQRHTNGFSRQDNLQVHINTCHKGEEKGKGKGKGKGTRQPSGVVKKQHVKRQVQKDMLRIIINMSRELLKQLESDDDDADSVLVDEDSNDEDDEGDGDSCD